MTFQQFLKKASSDHSLDPHKPLEEVYVDAIGSHNVPHHVQTLDLPDILCWLAENIEWESEVVVLV